MEVAARQLTLPKSYGTPHRVLTWTEVEQKLVASKTYWLATVRQDGRPHTVPVDGIWWERALYFGGDPATVHVRNLRATPGPFCTRVGRVPGHRGGRCGVAPAEPRRDQQPGRGHADEVRYPVSPDSYRAGTWRMAPVLVLAWNVLYEDATRFTFA